MIAKIDKLKANPDNIENIWTEDYTEANSTQHNPP